MALSILTSGNLQVTPFKLERLLDLKIIPKFNEHTRLTFTGIVLEEDKDQCLREITRDSLVEVNQMSFDHVMSLLFRGLVSQIELKTVHNINYLEVEAVSLTQMLDCKLKSRSFQNKDLSYEALIKGIVSEYDGDIRDEVSRQKKIGKMVMQYQETDWQFLKRLASHFNTGLIPYDLADKPKLFFGLPEPEDTAELESYNYRVSKKLAEYRCFSENHDPSLGEADFIHYEVESEQSLKIGDMVSFNGIKLYVGEAISFLENNRFRHHYCLKPQKGLSQPQLYNEKIVGLSLEGQVIAVDKDRVKVHLAIDEKQTVENAWWFSYSSAYTAEGNSGFYYMPERDDTVLVYFPDKNEDAAMAISSVRKDVNPNEKNKISNPDIKYFRTKAGKELMFSPSEVVISGKDNKLFVKMNDKDGILVCSNKAVKVIAKEDLIMESEEAKVIVKAKEGIDLSCDNSKINLDKTTVVVTGDEVKTN